METKEVVESKVVREPRTAPTTRRYTFDEKLKAVRLHLQEGFPQALVAEETGVSTSSLAVWVRAVNRTSQPKHGEDQRAIMERNAWGSFSATEPS